MFSIAKAVKKFVPVMSRPWVLVFLLSMIALTSQFEWKQQFGNEVDPKPISSSKEHIDRREGVVKEKIILSRESNIQKLEEIVSTLRRQLQFCRGDHTNGTFMPLDKI